ncbi:MAG TPA: Stk1 family PASTA domain-containing Ser/Thr kinase [Candidatus Blautia intestinigallinarum]|nr:Stk1 family PASTA domain-containing Ser/Thr kinase [Candidatus Blautia intestinigallinarum]
MLKTGMIIGERYEIVGKIGSGGMADVYKGKDHKLNRYVAIKVLKPEFREDTKFIKKFQTEAQSAAGLTHPNVVNVYDVGNDDGVYYIVMELIEGITLKEYISKKGKLSIKEATSIAIQVSMGLEAAHSHGIVHRDVKPQNIIISTDGKVKVTDFGIARAASSNTISSNAMGSVHYSSPEQVRGGYSDEKSDIYSLGITLYEMVTGVVPFDGDTTVAIAIKHLQEEMVPPSTYTPELPYSLERIIEKCTQKSVDRRYRNMGEVIADLKHSLIDPDGDFVKLASLTNGAQTVIISDSELKKIKDNNVVSAPASTPEPESIRTRNEFEDDPYDESYDDGYDDDERHGIHSGLEKAMSIGAWILGAVILCLLILVIGRAAGILNFGSSGNSDSRNEQSADDQAEDLVEVPDLVGMTEEEAEDALSQLGLGRKKSGEEVSDQEKGLISSQDPEAGQKVEKNTTIYYNVSKGEESLTVPDVTNRTQEDAEQILADMGFVVNVEKVYIDDYDTYVDAGYVISTDPEAGTSANSGDQITILVSRGEDWGDSISVPDVVGMTESDAKLALAKFSNVTVVSEQNANVTQGEVFEQSLEAYSYVSPDEPITIKVSSGNTAPTATPTPAVSASGSWKCTQQLAKPDGYQNGKIRLELMQTVNGEPQVSVIVEGQVLEFPYQLDITGAPGVTEGTIYLYEEVGEEDYQLEGQYPVTFEEVEE